MTNRGRLGIFSRPMKLLWGVPNPLLRQSRKRTKRPWLSAVRKTSGKPRCTALGRYAHSGYGAPILSDEAISWDQLLLLFEKPSENSHRGCLPAVITM